MVCLICKDLHIGIYGLIEQANEILVIRKSRGPYQGLLDLPGGRPCHGEPILDALKREIKEETGIEANSYSFFGNFSFLIPYQDSEGHQRELYHIALTYRVNQVDLTGFNASIIDEDVNGSLWVNWHNIKREQCSPLLKGVIENYDK